VRLKNKRKNTLSIASMPIGSARFHSSFFIIFGFCLFLLSTMNTGFMSASRMVVIDVSAPLIATINKPVTHVSETIRNVSGLASLQAENARLVAENQKLQEWYQRAQLLQSENVSLQKLLNISTSDIQYYVTAPLLADTGNAFLKSILIRAGASENVQKGQAVISHDGLLGRVIETGQSVSRVLLLSDLNSRVPVLVLGTNQRAVLAGQNDGDPRLIHLPDNIEIADGARIVTSGHGGLFPAGLSVGTVHKAESGYVVSLMAQTHNTQYVKVVGMAAQELAQSFNK